MRTSIYDTCLQVPGTGTLVPGTCTCTCYCGLCTRELVLSTCYCTCTWYSTWYDFTTVPGTRYMVHRSPGPGTRYQVCQVRYQVVGICTSYRVARHVLGTYDVRTWQVYLSAEEQKLENDKVYEDIDSVSSDLEHNFMCKQTL